MVVGAQVTLRDRAKYSGIIEAVIALSNGLGPTVGGALTAEASWVSCSPRAVLSSTPDPCVCDYHCSAGVSGSTCPSAQPSWPPSSFACPKRKSKATQKRASSSLPLSFPRRSVDGKETCRKLKRIDYIGSTLSLAASILILVSPFLSPPCDPKLCSETAFALVVARCRCNGAVSLFPGPRPLSSRSWSWAGS